MSLHTFDLHSVIHILQRQGEKRACINSNLQPQCDSIKPLLQFFLDIPVNASSTYMSQVTLWRCTGSRLDYAE